MTLLQGDPLEAVWDGGRVPVRAEPLPYSPVE